MKKFLEFIKELMGPLVGTILYFVVGFLAFVWVLTFFGLFVFVAPSPTWVRWVVGVFDSFCVIMLIYSWVHGAYEKVYKQK